MADIDREKVIEILSRHKIMTFGDKLYDGIQFDLGDVVAMLKEQEPIKPIKVDEMYYCGKCRKGPIGFLGNEHNGDKFCRNCGQAVKWD